MANPSFHEDFGRTERIEGPSDRRFGLWFAAIAAAIGALKLWRGSTSGWYWLLAGAVFLALALTFARALAPLNRLWLKLGLLLFKVVNPVVMAILFFVTILPMALVLRAMGRDLLRLKRDPTAPSYWLPREPPGPRPEDMQHQF
jgi:hypothetical protein